MVTERSRSRALKPRSGAEVSNYYIFTNYLFYFWRYRNLRLKARVIRFKIEQTENSLTLGHRWYYVMWLWFSEGLGILASLLVFVIPLETLQALHKYAFLIYAIPLFLLLRLIKRLYRFHKRKTYKFVKNEDALYGGRKILTQLSLIRQLELADKGSDENHIVFIQLVSIENEKIILLESNRSSKSLIKAGITIAKFINVEFLNTNSLYDRIIWGGVNASDAEIKFLENDMN